MSASSPNSVSLRRRNHSVPKPTANRTVNSSVIQRKVWLTKNSFP